MLEFKHLCKGRMGYHRRVGERPSARPGQYGVPASRAAWDSVDYLLNDWARERPGLDFTPVGVILRMGRVRRHLERRLGEVFARHGLTAADFQVLVNLRRSGEPYCMPQARLMEALGLTSGTVSLRLDRLVKAGTVRREPDPDDRRGSLIRLTADGLRLFEAVAPEHLANEERLLSALTTEQRTTLADLLRHVLASLEPAPCAAPVLLGLSVESAVVARSRRLAVGLSDTAGLLVAHVEPGSPADAAGLIRGDLIVEANGRQALSTVTLAELLEDLPQDAGVALTVLRGNDSQRVTVRPGGGAAPRRRRKTPATAGE
jgi:DNA-binding MarR family transcriptional regulator